MLKQVTARGGASMYKAIYGDMTKEQEQRKTAGDGNCSPETSRDL